MAQVPIRNRGNSQCSYHKMEVIMACIDCGGELVCSQCINSTHNPHKFESISQVVDKKKKNMQDYVKILQKTQLPSITKTLEFADNQIKENTNHFESLQKQITLQGEKIKKKVDKITKESIEKCREIERQNLVLLDKYKQELKDLYTQLCKVVKQCKDTLKTENKVMIIDVEKDIQQEVQLPNAPNCKTAEFIVESKHLLDDFGSLSVTEAQKPYRSNDSTVKSEFMHSTGIRSVARSTPDRVWLPYFDDKYTVLVTLEGRVKQKLKLGSYVHDISVSSVTGFLWLCCRNKAVYEISDNEPNKRFTTNDVPLCLCITPNNNVVVGTDVDITVYSTVGLLLHSTQQQGSFVPHHVTVYTSTGDIAVCDTADYTGIGKLHVSVYSSKLDRKYQYYGPPKSVMEYDLWPADVVYDTQGHLLIADYNNKCIQLVSGEGKFLTVVHTDTLQPRALTLIQDGVLCVGFDDKKVKVIRYRV